MRCCRRLLVAWCVVFAAAAHAQVDPRLLTAAERSEFKATATSAEVVALCQALAEQSPLVRKLEIGQSGEGREIPALLVSNPPVASAGEARQSGKLVVLMLGNIHAGEVEGKEALPVLVRELTLGAAPSPLLDSVVLLVVPNFNPDGNDRVSKDNRPGQVGPEQGMGTRENAQGLDLNRDFMKLESPEARALARLLSEWNPHLFIDTHTTNGSKHRFTITHAGPKSTAGSRAVNDYVHATLLPAVDAAMAPTWNSFPYGNFSRDKSRWVTFGSEPRYATSYVGLRNRIAILSEAYAYAPYRDRVFATRDFCRAILEFAAEHKGDIAGLLDRAAGEAKVGDEVAIRSVLRARPDGATVLGYADVARGEGASSAAPEPKDYKVELWDDFEPKETVRRPVGYLLPAEHSRVADCLKAHGLHVEALPNEARLEVEGYRVTRVLRSERAFQKHQLVLDVEVEPTRGAETIGAGTLCVSATGALGSLAVMLLEPRSEDGLVTWNLFDDGLREGERFPVLRLLEPLPAVAAPAVVQSQTQQQQAPAQAAPARAQQRRRSDSPPVRIGTGLRASMVPGAAGFVRWLDDDHIVQNRDSKAMKVNALTGAAEPLEPEAAVDRGRLAAALAGLPTIDEGAGRALADRATLDGSGKGAFVEYQDDLYYGAIDGSKSLRLTSTPGKEELAEFSPDGSFVAFVRDNDLYVVDVATGAERALTTGGSDRVRHGKADWVYFEEIFDRSWKAFWWSPDSKHIAFLRIDNTTVPLHQVLIDTGGTRIVEETPYPRSGEPNPQVQFGIVSASGGAPIYADLGEYSPDSFLISDAGWWPDGQQAYFYGQDRAQTWLDVLVLSPRGGVPKRLFRDKTGAWVESLGPIHVLKDGTFLVASERDGWKHLYRYKPDGVLVNQVTSGEWEMRGVVRIDEENGWVYVNGTRDNPLGNNLYRAKLDGTALERVTDGPGTHAGVLNPSGTLVVDISSGRELPPRGVLRKADGTEVRALGEDDAPPVADGGPKTEIVQIPARDGTPLEAEVILPPNLDTSGNTLYPVWLMTYGGPHFPTISDGWRGGGGVSGLAASLLREGYIIFRIDPRSASGKGAKSAWTAYRRLGVQELEDIKDAVAWLKQRPYVDGARIGMSGHSYGGYLTAFCMTHSDLFAAGIAGAPVTDWRDYDSIYTERYMDTPQNNPEGYDASSVTKAAKNLHGKLLIAHGGIDDNVSVRNTMRFIHELQQANKDFELMIYPSARHGIGSPHYQRLQLDFIKRSLGGPKARESASTNGAR